MCRINQWINQLQCVGLFFPLFRPVHTLLASTQSLCSRPPLLFSAVSGLHPHNHGLLSYSLWVPYTLFFHTISGLPARLFVYIISGLPPHSSTQSQGSFRTPHQLRAPTTLLIFPHTISGLPPHSFSAQSLDALYTIRSHNLWASGFHSSSTQSTGSLHTTLGSLQARHSSSTHSLGSRRPQSSSKQSQAPSTVLIHCLWISSTLQNSVWVPGIHILLPHSLWARSILFFNSP